jgi:ankyrin repeat protein
MDVNSQDGDGNTALHHASSSSPNNGRDGGELSSLDVVKILVDEYGADVLRRNGAGSASYDAASTQAVRDYLRKVAIRIAFEIVDQDHEGRVLAARLEHMPR